MLVTMIGTSLAWSYSHCTLVSNSVLNRRKERLREAVQLAKGQTARKYRSRFGASYPLKSFHTFSCYWEITDCFLNTHTAFPLAALRMMFPPILSEFYTFLKVISGGPFLKLLDWMWCVLLSQPHSTLHLMYSVFCVHISIFFIQQYKLLEVDIVLHTQ